jgi:hypothetical protein
MGTRYSNDENNIAGSIDILSAQSPQLFTSYTSNESDTIQVATTSTNVMMILPPPIAWFDNGEDECIVSDYKDFNVSRDARTENDDAVIPLDKTCEDNELLQDKKQYTIQYNNILQADKISNAELEHDGRIVPGDKSKWLAAAAGGSPAPSPSWKQISQQILPMAAKELFSTAMYQIWYSARMSYAFYRTRRQYSDYGNSSAGYYRPTNPPNSKFVTDFSAIQLPPFSTLPWVERQIVKEWRSYLPDNFDVVENDDNVPLPEFDEDIDFDRARTLIPMQLSRPTWKMADSCMDCYQTFGPTCLRHHCRNCGNSYCHKHSTQSHALPHLGYHPNVPERVCDRCKRILLDQNLAERMAWRLARCRDLENGQLQPYFEIGLDSIDQMVLRITQAAITMAKAIPLGAQASVAVETLDVLRKYGLHGIYTIMLRQEFLAAADLLLKALGINRTAWPLSVHELSAAIFYALAQHRAMRGLYPDREHLIHTIRNTSMENGMTSSDLGASTYVVEDDALHFVPVCDALPDKDLMSLLLYAPIALNFIYVEREVDMQLLAAQQGWRLLYSYLEQADIIHMKLYDRPASAIFVHEERKIACMAIRGTTTIHDVITDIRQVPVPFPDFETVTTKLGSNEQIDEEWTTVFRGKGLAASGMVGAAVNLYCEHIDSLLVLYKQGYRIRLTGHSLGGSVAVLLGVLVYKDLLSLIGKETFDSMGEDDAPLLVYAYGTPSCVDLPLAKAVEPFVTTVVLHDDVVPRLTPASCRGLLKHLLHIRETWVNEHLGDDIRAFTDRAKTAWAPRWRSGFTLSTKTSVKLKRYCRKHIHYGHSQFRYVKERLVGDNAGNVSSKNHTADHENDFPDSPLLHSPQSETAIGNTEYDQEPKLVIDFLGGLPVSSEGMVVDGDEFFDTGVQLLDAGDDTSNCSNDIVEQNIEHVGNGENTVQLNSDANLVDGECTEIHGAVVLDEVPLPRMFVPGKIAHIYSHRGVYKASYVPRTFRELRRISLAGNMLSNHKTKSYYDALSEVANVRQALENPPEWTAFDDDDTWYVKINLITNIIIISTPII